MQTMKYFIVIGCVLLLTACVSASNKQLKLAQQSVAQGNYAQAFDQAAQSLQTDIGNHKTIALFPGIVQHAYTQKLGEIQQHQSRQHWDQAAYGYDRMVAMNQAVQGIQTQLNTYAQKANTSASKREAMKRLLALSGHDVSAQRDDVYGKAAAAHYVRGKQYVAAQQHRQANRAFRQALTFIADYQDAISLAASSKRLADLADASKYYGQALAAVKQQQHRTAARAFARAVSFVADFRDAAQLAVKYKTMADQQDALLRYNEGHRLAQDHQYRAAGKAFREVSSFVPGYRDATHLSGYYMDLANKEDARQYYSKAMRLMDRQDFSRAARAFDKANQFVAGYRNAREMAAKARSQIAPASHQLQRMVQASVKYGIPLTWLHDVHQGYTEEVKITSVSVMQRGRFNSRHEYWPYRLHLRGTCELEISESNEQDMSFDTVIDYRVFRDDFGNWKATFQQLGKAH